MYKHYILTIFLSVLVLPLSAMEREITKSEGEIVLKELEEARKKLSNIISISMCPSDSDSNVADPNSMAYKRQSLGHTKQEIWGSTILVGVFLCEKGKEILNTLHEVTDKNNALESAENEYIKAASLYMQGYINGYQKEALNYIYETLDPLLDIENQKLKNTQQIQDYKVHKKLPIFKEKLNNLIKQETERIKLKKENRGSRAFSIPIGTVAITKICDEAQRINNTIMFAQAIIGWAKECNSSPSFDNCAQCKKLCYQAILSFFNVHELNKSEEALNSIDDVLQIAANSDRWIYNNARDKWEMDTRLNNAAIRVTKIRKDLKAAKELREIKELAEHIQNPLSLPLVPKKEPSPRSAEYSWQEFLYITTQEQKKSPGRNESPRKSKDNTPERGGRSRSGSGSGSSLKKAVEDTLTKIFKKP